MPSGGHALPHSSCVCTQAYPAALQICFTPALREASLRRQLFANALALCRETRGRGIVVSSGARSYTELRGPLDVANLASLFGLTQQQALATISSSPAAVVERAATRRAYRGTLTVRIRAAEEVAAIRAQQQQEAGEAAQQQQCMDVDPVKKAMPPFKPTKFAMIAGRG